MVSLAQDAACAGKDLSLGWLLQHHPPCAWKEGKATATTAKFLLRFTGKRVAVGAGKHLALREFHFLAGSFSLYPYMRYPEGNRLASLLLLYFLSFSFPFSSFYCFLQGINSEVPFGLEGKV